MLHARNPHPDCTYPKHDGSWSLGPGRPGRVEPLPGFVREQRFETRETIFSDGDLVTGVWLLVTGAATLSKLMPDGRRQIVDILGPGDFVAGEEREVHWCDAAALGEATAVYFDRRAIDASQEVRDAMADQAARELAAMREQMLTLGRKSAEERVATFIVNLVPGFAGPGCLCAEGCRRETDIPLTRAEIADYLGLTLETVSRTFGKLKSAGVIAYRRNETVEIGDPCGLCRIASGSC